MIAGLEKKPDFRFADVMDDKAYYYDAVYWAYHADPQITAGVNDTDFGPNQICTRAQIVTFLWHAAGDPVPRDERTAFTDVDAGSYYAQAVTWAVQEGITSGVSQTEFGPDVACTRAQIVTFLWLYAGSPEPESTDTGFVDVKPGAYYAKAVAWAVENGITTGVSSACFAPGRTCTRAQAVTFLYRLCGME